MAGVRQRILPALWRAALRLRPARRRVQRHPRVCFLLAHAWGTGGTIRTTLNLAGALASTHDVEVLSLLRLRRTPAFGFPEGVRVTAIDDARRRSRRSAGRLERWLRSRPGRLVHHSDRLWRRCSLWTDLQLLRALWRLDADVLVATRPSLTLIVAEAAPPRVRRVSAEHLSFGTRPARVRRLLERRLGRLDAVVTLTEADRAAYAAVAPPSLRVAAIPNGVTPLDGPPSPLSHPVVISFGRLAPQKDQLTLIRAFAPIALREPHWSLRICGEGRMRARLEAEVLRLGLVGRVELPGRVTDVGRELDGASVFALSSRFEGFPMALLEAMGKGVPVVCTDCPTGPRELVEPRANGLLVPVGDVGALTAALIELVESDARRRRLGAGALVTASAYGLDGVARRWSALFAELMGASVR